MIKQQLKLKKQKLKYQGKVTTTSNKSLLVGSIIATVIALVPYFFTLYESVPTGRVWDTFLFSYESNYYESITVVAWTLSNKLIPLLLLLIWFFTNRHWWYHALLVPIAMYFYQIIVILNDDLDFADSNQIIYLLPVMAIVIPSIYLIRARMFNKINDADSTMQDFEDEFRISPKGFWGKISQYF